METFADPFFRLFFQTAPVGLNLCTMEGTWLESNPSFLRMLGYTQEEANGRLTYWQLTPPEYYEQEQFQLKRLREEGKYGPYEKEFIRSDGTRVPVRLNGFVIVKDGQPFIWSIIEDITERKTLETELRAAIAARDEFLSIASHELKTPLTALSLQLQTLYKRHQAPQHPCDSALIQRSLVSCRKLGDLVSQLLDIARIRVGRLSLRKHDTDLTSVVREAVALMAEESQAHGTRIRVREQGPVVGYWDPQRINQVVVNLLSNALKFGEGEPVDVEVHLDPARERAVLSVRDHGRGIAPELQRRIFDRFERAPQGRTISGLGLGLYVCRQVVEAHGGQIRVESAPHQGARFVVELPLSAHGPTGLAHPPAPPAG